MSGGRVARRNGPVARSTLITSLRLTTLWLPLLFVATAA